MPAFDPTRLAPIATLAPRFAGAEPFRHVVLDGFFPPDFAEALLAQFPRFEDGNSTGDDGTPSNKAVVERIRGIGSAYAALDDLMQDRAFLDWIGAVTGIENLLYDPYWFGGGTHENRPGQDLDPHVDFNRHPVERWHRRLNLIVYLNPEWDDAWGGSLELLRDPRAPHAGVATITPLFNRAVVFETNETSWHGFPRIAPPRDRADVTRRSVALYFYTTDRPAAETAPAHSTIYVDRQLPERFRAGHTLDAQDVAELDGLLRRRDQHCARIYGELTRTQQRLDTAHTALTGGWVGRMRWLLARVLARLRPRG